MVCLIASRLSWILGSARCKDSLRRLCMRRNFGSLSYLAQSLSSAAFRASMRACKDLYSLSSAAICSWVGFMCLLARRR